MAIDLSAEFHKHPALFTVAAVAVAVAAGFLVYKKAGSINFNFGGASAASAASAASQAQQSSDIADLIANEYATQGLVPSYDMMTEDQPTLATNATVAAATPATAPAATDAAFQQSLQSMVSSSAAAGTVPAAGVIPGAV